MTEVLKVIGLIMLCLLLLLLLLVVFAGWTPFRYRLKLQGGTEREQKMNADAAFWWAGPLIRVIANVTDSGYRVYVKVLWIYLFDSAKPMEDSSNRFARFVLKKLGVYEEDISDTEIRSQEAPSPKKEEPQGEKPQEKQDNASNGSNQRKDNSAKEPAKTKVTGWKQKFLEKYEKIRFQIQHICDKIKKIAGIIRQIYEIGEQTFVKRFLKNLFCQLWHMFCYVIPYSVKGKASFGIKDQPELMGKILMWLGIFYPLYGRQVLVEPTFEQSMADVDLVIKGRIRLYRVVYYMLRIIIHPSTFQVINYIRKQEVL